MVLGCGLLAVCVALGVLRWVPRVVLDAGVRPSRWAVPCAAVLGAGSGLVGSAPWAAVMLAVVGGACGVVVAVDLAERRIPDSVVLPALGLWFIAALPLAALTDAWVALGRSALAALVAFAAMLALGVLVPGGPGFGDVKLAPLLGGVLGWYGWAPLLWGFLAAIVVHGVAAAVVLAVTRDRGRDVPMGPALVVGAASAVALAAFAPGAAG